jgi:UV DNA damage repair endonuclease
MYVRLFIFSYNYIRWRLYNIWLKNGKPNDPTNHLLLQKKQNKKEFRWAVRIEVARQKEIEKVNIMEARSNIMELFHKLIQKNRKKSLEHIQDINVQSLFDVLPLFWQLHGIPFWYVLSVTVGGW